MFMIDGVNILRTPRRAANIAVRAELGRYPMVFSTTLQTVRFWCHVLHSDNILLKAAYRNEIYTDLNTKPSWVGMVRGVLLECEEK